MSFSPRSIGESRGLHNIFTTDSGTYSVAGLSPSQLQMHFVDTSNSVHTVGTGTWSNISGNTADYQPANTDVIQTTAGTYSMYATANGIPMDAQLIDIVDPTKA